MKSGEELPNSLSAMHRRMADRLGPKTALRYKRNGLYHDVSWTEYRRLADRVAAGLMELGVEVGDRVAILSENRVEWLITDVGILAAGAADVSLHSPLAPPQVAYQLSHSGARGVFVSNQKQADKVFEVIEHCPDLTFMVAFDPIDVPEAIASRLRFLTWLEMLGLAWSPDADVRVIKREAQVNRESLSALIYTSGTTGNPKGVMLTHDNLLSNAEAMFDVSILEPTDILLSWLPYSHIYARTCDHYQTTYAGSIVALAESVDTLIVNLEEVQPMWMTSVPRFYEKVWSIVEGMEPKKQSRRLKEIFGPRLRWLSSGGAPLPVHVCKGFTEAGLDLLEGYGLTETSPVICFNRKGQTRIGAVGQCIPGVEVKIAADGEILTRGPHVMKGYWKNPEATAEVIVDGWFHTGDVGKVDDDGYLYITDRKKDLIITSSGKNIAPTEIERILVSDPFIDHAVLYGDRKHFITAILAPNLSLLEQKAREFDCELVRNGEFICESKLHAFLAERVARLMEQVSTPERVKKFLILGRAFQLELDELTATLKVRRRQITNKFNAELEALYQESA